MSVINQMLKDLDQRQADQVNNDQHQVPRIAPTSSRNVLVISIVVIILLNVAGIFAWQLYTENQALKVTNAKYDINQQAQQLADSLARVYDDDETRSKINALVDDVEQSKKTVENKAAETAPVKIKDVEDKARNQQDLQKKVANETKNKTPVLLNTKNSQIEKETLVEPVIEELVKTNQAPKLTISRKQLSAEELVQQKITQAEQAISDNHIDKAERLFEDVLLIIPQHKSARKQLAALWFGRQANQAALNLLSQGIALAPQDSEYRLMKARIYLNQGQVKLAVDTLVSLSTIKNVEYQTLLANSAQQSAQFSTASFAYKQLTNMEPNVGRWWLGLAVAYDSNSQFSQAANAYQQAVKQSNLSESAVQFAQRRLQELGE